MSEQLEVLIENFARVQAELDSITEEVARLINENSVLRLQLKQSVGPSEVRDAALEEAANLADVMGDDYFARYKGRPPYSADCEGRAAPYYEGMSDGAGNAADAIRALKSKKEA